MNFFNKFDHNEKMLAFITVLDVVLLVIILSLYVVYRNRAFDSMQNVSDVVEAQRRLNEANRQDAEVAQERLPQVVRTTVQESVGCEEQLNTCVIELLEAQKDYRECLNWTLEGLTEKLGQKVKEK